MSKLRILTMVMAIFLIGSLILLPIGVSGKEYTSLDTEDEVILVPQLYVDGNAVQIDEETNLYTLTDLLPGPRLLTTDGELDCSILITAGEWRLDTDLTITGSLTLTGGKLTTGAHTINADSVFIGQYTNDTTVTLNINGSTFNVFNWSLRGDDIRITAGTSTINCTLLFDNATKKGHIYSTVNIYDKVISPTNTIYGLVEGNSTFKNLTINGNTYMRQSISTESYTLKKGRVILDAKAPLTITTSIGTASVN